MKNKLIISGFFLLCFYAGFGQRLDYLKMDDSYLRSEFQYRRFDSSKALERGIQKAIQRLNDYTRLGFGGFATQNGLTFSHPQYGLIINVEDLKEAIDRFPWKNDKIINQLIFLLLSHEAAHQIQFRRYGAALMSELSPEEKKVMECQADILGGFLMHYVLGGEIEDGGYLTLSEGMDRLLKADVNQYSISFDHPSLYQRKMAVTSGLKYAQMLEMQEALQEQKNGSALFQSPHLRYDLAQMANDVNWDNRLDTLENSRHLAEIIIGYCSEASKEIGLVKKAIKYYRRGKHPHADYTVSLINSGTFPVSVHFSIESTIVSDAGDRFYVDRIPFLVNLNAGAQSTIKGSIKLQASSLGVNEVFIPPYLNQKMFFEAADCNKVHPAGRYLFDNPGRQFSLNAYYAFSLATLMDALEKKFKEVVSGPYVITDSGSRLYQSRIALPNSLSNEIELFPDGKAIFHSLLLTAAPPPQYQVVRVDEPASPPTAQKMYDQAQQQIGKILKDLKVDYTTPEEEIVEYRNKRDYINSYDLSTYNCILKILYRSGGTIQNRVEITITTK